MNRNAVLLLSILGIFLLILPTITNAYVLSVATLILFFAYTGQAWNVMMGFCGQLSLGHSLYVGVGAYAAAGLFFHYGVGPWAGAWVAVALCVALGAAMVIAGDWWIGALAGKPVITANNASASSPCWKRKAFSGARRRSNRLAT